MPAVSQDNVVENTTIQSNPTMYQITTNKPDGEYTDQELLNLVNYFEVSRVELKNVRHEFLLPSKGDLFRLTSELILYLHNRFSKLNKSIPKHRNYSKVDKEKPTNQNHFTIRHFVI